MNLLEAIQTKKWWRRKGWANWRQPPVCERIGFLEYEFKLWSSDLIADDYEVKEPTPTIFDRAEAVTPK